MPYRAKFGMGRGFGFGGYSPPWPHIGRGRGGLPRCWAYGAVNPNYGMTYPDQGGFAAPGMSPVNQPPSPNQELTFLKNQAEVLRHHLDQIDARVKALEDRGEPS
jgi:hypothetical protein